MKYMAVLTREVLEASAQQKRNAIPIDCICAISNSGLWKQDFQISQDVPQKEQKKKLKRNQADRFQMHESTIFKRMIKIKNLKKHFKTLSYQEDEVSKYICEFCISALSLMMLNENYCEAWDYVQEVCEPIAEHYKFDQFKAKLLLLKTSLAILIDDSQASETLLGDLKYFEDLLQQNSKNDPSVYADYYYLQARLKIKLVQNLQVNPANQSQLHVQQQEKPIQSEQQSTTSLIMGHSQPSTPQIQEEIKQFESFSPTRTPKQEQMMMQKLDKASSIDTSISRVSGKKEFNIGQIEKEIYLNLRQARKTYSTTDGIANCLYSEAEFKLSPNGYILYFKKLDDSKSDVNQKDKSLIQASDSDQVDLKAFDQYFDENVETLNIARALYGTLGKNHLEAKTFTLIGQLWIKKFELYVKEEEKKLDKEQLRSYISRAVDNLENASQIYQQLKDQIEQMKISDLIQKTQDQSCLIQDNMVIFANSFPLFENVEFNQQQQLEIGPLTQYKKDFVIDFKKLAGKIPLIMKQEILNKPRIVKIVENKLKILHLKSQISHPTDLCIEGENARAKYINCLEIINEFSFQDPKYNFERTYLRADLVVLAMPTSKCQAEEFIKLNVKNVVAFNFESLLKQEKTINLMPMINEYIVRFCLSFYQHILSREDTVFEAFGKAETENEELLAGIIKKFIKQEQVSAMFNKVEIDYIQRSEELKPKIRPILYLTEKESYIFEKQPGNQNKFSNSTNLLMDTSQPLPKSNIDSYLQKYVNSYTGRKNIMQKVYEEIQNPNVKILEINGESGIGKTRLALEAAEYLRRRNRFQQGIYYHDMKKVQTIDQFEEITSQYYYLQFNEQKEKDGKQFCLIFDHIEDISHDTDYLDKILISMLEVYTFAKIIVISREKIFDQKGNVKSLVVSRLNSDETVEFVYANCKLNLADNLIAIIDKKQKDNGNVSSDHSSLKRYLQSHNAIINCDGNPKALLELCKIFEDKGTTEDAFQIEEEFKEFKNPKVSNNESKPQLHQYMSKTNQNDGPHNPELPPFSREEKKRRKESFPSHFEHHHNLTYDENDESQPMDSAADNFDHLNQFRNTMLEEIEQKTLKTALEKSKREQ